MHATDDVHARAAAMVARAAAVRSMTARARHLVSVLATPRRANGHFSADGDLLACIDHLKTLSEFDAALARAFDEA